jgi:hypothetical protein
LTTGGLLKAYTDAITLIKLRNASLAAGADLESFENTDAIEVFEIFEQVT